MSERPPTRLYLITPARIALDAFVPLFTDALGAGDIAAVQLRLKGVSDAEAIAAGERLAPIAQAAGAAFLVNDRPDLALAIGADGVHVGQDDAPYAHARRLLGPDRIVGVTCHDSRHLAMLAAEAGADYVAFGAFYPTATKDPKARAELDLLSWWQELMETPCVAIGGITAATAGAVAKAGADFIAVSGAVWSHPDGPAEGVRALTRALAG